MGNSSSKNKRESSNPGFSRTDTQTSTRSGRSIRSAKSSRSRRSMTDEDRSSSAIATPKDQPSSAGATAASSANEGQDGYPFPSVPRSMQVVSPKEPILLYRDKDGNITNPSTPFNENGPNGPEAKSPNARAISIPDQTPSGSSNGGLLSANLSTGSGSNLPATPRDVTGSASRINGELPFGASPRTPGASQLLGGISGSVNVDDTIQLLLDAGYSGKTARSFCLKNSEIGIICQAAREIFLSQPTLLELSPPVKVVGDIHGQYGDLLRLFNMCGFPPQSNYLFLGDYVDRGKQSLETMVLLLLYKIKYPENFFILRGNHECAGVTRIYGFYDECKRRSSIKTWRMFVDTFNTLPIAAVVAQKIFCVHGGLSPSLNNVNDIRSIERPTDVPDYGLLNDLLWSDPTDGPNEWEDNERGVSYCFNKTAINKFLARFGFDLVCRAHMVVEDGYEFFNDRSLVTVFSAPNYCGEFDNWGAAMSVSEGLLCSFELLKPLDSAALKEEMRMTKEERKAAAAS